MLLQELGDRDRIIYYSQFLSKIVANPAMIEETPARENIY